MTGKMGVHSAGPGQLRRFRDVLGLPGAGLSAEERGFEVTGFERWRAAGVRRGWLHSTTQQERRWGVERDVGGARSAAIAAAAWLNFERT